MVLTYQISNMKHIHHISHFCGPNQKSKKNNPKPYTNFNYRHRERSWCTAVNNDDSNSTHNLIFIYWFIYIFVCDSRTHNLNCHIALSVFVYIFMLLCDKITNLILHSIWWNGIKVGLFCWSAVGIVSSLPVCIQFVYFSSVRLLFTTSTTDSHTVLAVLAYFYLCLYKIFCFCFENTRYPSLNQCNVNSWFYIINWLLAWFFLTLCQFL